MSTFHFTIKSGKKGTAVEHSLYIAREGKHRKDDEQNDLVVTQHGNLPEWTKGNPLEMWRAADQHERTNGSAYREFEIALPNELNTEQHLEIVQSLITGHVGVKPFQFAIHNPTSSIEGVAQPHLHFMMSDRIDDGLERSPEQFFKRHNKTHPERGGCKKDSGGKEPCVLKEQVVTLRKNVASIINDKLEVLGFNSRVDHRSHRDRGLDTQPEKHLGQAAVNRMAEEDKVTLKEKRKGKIE